MKIAIVDMGTNTFHLLLARLGQAGKYEIIHREYAVVKIGKGGINEGLITGDAFKRAVDAMIKFRRVMDQHDVKVVHAFGTSAVRNARNGLALTREIKSTTGIDVTILSGDEEAELIFRGIQEALDLGDKVSLVMDIGAGSVEFIIGNNRKLFWKQSFEIGGQRLLERFMKHDPIAADEIDALTDHFGRELRALPDQLEAHSPEILVGSSGSFDTFSEIFCMRNDIRYDPAAAETPLSIEGFRVICDDLLRANRAQRMAIPGMIEMRVDMIVVAAVLVRYVMSLHAFKGIRVSTYSLKEGALAKLAASNSPA